MVESHGLRCPISQQGADAMNLVGKRRRRAMRRTQIREARRAVDGALRPLPFRQSYVAFLDQLLLASLGVERLSDQACDRRAIYRTAPSAYFCLLLFRWQSAYFLFASRASIPGDEMLPFISADIPRPHAVAARESFSHASRHVGSTDQESLVVWLNVEI